MTIRRATPENLRACSRVGEIEVSYAKLCEAFGEPDTADLSYKSTASWPLMIDDEPIEIYDWKIGIGYLGPEEGLPLGMIRVWEVDGRSEKAVAAVLHALFPNETT